MLDIDSLLDSLIVLAIWPYIWNCLHKHWHVPPYITDPFLSLSIVGSNWLARPCSLPSSPAPFPSPERARDLLHVVSLGLLRVPTATCRFLPSTHPWHARWDHNRQHEQRSVLLHGPSEDVGVRTTAHLVHKTVHGAFTNHNNVLANTIGNFERNLLWSASWSSWASIL
jgi:hypothetical protein